MQTEDEVRPDARDDVRDGVARQALAHMVEVVGSTPYEREPFPHFIAHGIFPPDVYDELLSQLPGDDDYEPFNPSRPGWSNPAKAAKRLVSQPWSGDRGRFQLTNTSIDALDGRRSSFWLGIRDALGAPEFKRAVFARLGDGLQERFGDDQDAADLPGFPLPELFREKSGYAIKPHPDTPTKVVTMQIALPRDASHEELGTEFYRRSSNPLHRLREPRGFELAKRAPFLPNVAYAFVVNDHSWHGRTTLQGDIGVRDTILHLWFSKAKRGNADIVAEQYADAA